MDDEKIKDIIEGKLSGFFTRGKLSEHDANVVKKWAEKFIELCSIGEEHDAGD